MYNDNTAPNYYDSKSETIHISEHKTSKRYGTISIKVNTGIATIIELIHEYFNSPYILGREYSSIIPILKRLLKNDSLTISTIRKIHVSERFKNLEDDLAMNVMAHSAGVKFSWYYRKD